MERVLEQDQYLGVLAAKIEQQQAQIRALELEAEEHRQFEGLYRPERLIKVVGEKEYYRKQAKLRKKLDIEVRKLAKLRESERKRVLVLQQDEQRRKDKDARDKSAMQADLRHKAAEEVQKTRDRIQQEDACIQAHLCHEAITNAQRAQQKSLTEGRIQAYEGPVPSFLEEEYHYMKQASATFPEAITPSIQMSCIKDYQKSILEASRRLPCGLCGGLFQEEEVVNLSLQDANLLHFFEKTTSKPDCCAVKGNIVSLCKSCSSAVAKRSIPPLSAGNFVNCLFCQDYPSVLKNLNTVEEAFIARAHVIGMFLKLTSGARRGLSYRGSRGHCVAVRQDPSELLKILPARRLQDHTTITVSWDRGTPPSDENLARFCSVNKAKVLHALLWLCAHNPVYKSVSIDYSILDSWPDDHVPQEIRDAFIALGSEAQSAQPLVTDEREGYATSLQGGLFENDLDAEVEDAEPGSILSRSFFSDFHGQDMQSTSATLASLQAILEDKDLGSSVQDNNSGNDSGKSY
jgi:hypothetical protein